MDQLIIFVRRKMADSGTVVWSLVITAIVIGYAIVSLIKIGQDWEKLITKLEIYIKINQKSQPTSRTKFSAMPRDA